ncbi:hypothetical protein BARD7_02625 [Bacillus amyloliquefaciens]|nr:hypothetical protein BARD7_02625 [Bacillus amyloliquefaciens]
MTGRHEEKVKIDQAISDAGEFADDRPGEFTKASAKFNQCRRKFYKGNES